MHAAPDALPAIASPRRAAALAARALGAAAVVLALAACTTRSAIYEGRAADTVWVAMKAAAENPRYDDWHVIQNDVYADEAIRQVHIYRRLRRDVVGPGVQPFRQDAEYRLRASLGEAKSGDPEVTVVSRDSAIPAHAWSEIERYLDEIDELMGGDPTIDRISPTGSRSGAAE